MNLLKLLRTFTLAFRMALLLAIQEFSLLDLKRFPTKNLPIASAGARAEVFTCAPTGEGRNGKSFAFPSYLLGILFFGNRLRICL
jgi:hypothetical protein